MQDSVMSIARSLVAVAGLYGDFLFVGYVVVSENAQRRDLRMPPGTFVVAPSTKEWVPFMLLWQFTNF